MRRGPMEFERRQIADSRDRRAFIGGSDARIVMGEDEAALLRLWREKRGEAEPEDLSGNLIVQLGVGEMSGSNAVRAAGYFFLGGRRFRSRRPSPPPFSSMNSIPTRSKAARIASTAAR